MKQNKKETDQIVWRPFLQQQLGVGTETMRRYIKAGKLPPPDVNLSQRRQGWNLSTLTAAGIRLAGI